MRFRPRHGSLRDGTDRTQPPRVGRGASPPRAGDGGGTRPAGSGARGARRPDGTARAPPAMRDRRVDRGARGNGSARDRRRPLRRGARRRARALAGHRVGTGRRAEPALGAPARALRPRLYGRRRARVAHGPRRLGDGNRGRAAPRRGFSLARRAPRRNVRRSEPALARGLLRRGAPRLRGVVAFRAARRARAGGEGRAVLAARPSRLLARRRRACGAAARCSRASRSLPSARAGTSCAWALESDSS